jgi:hypothetical protein
MILLSHSEVIMTSTVLDEASHYLSFLLIVMDIVILREIEHILHTRYSMMTSMKRKGREKGVFAHADMLNPLKQVYLSQIVQITQKMTVMKKLFVHPLLSLKSIQSVRILVTTRMDD